MHIVIATDGTLEPGQAVPYVRNLAGADGRVTVLTVVEINRAMLRDLRALFGERSPARTDMDAEYVGVRTGDASGVSAQWPGDDEMIGRYLEDQAEQRTGELARALQEAGLPVDVVVREGEDPANEIITTSGELDADAVVIGSHGRGFFDGLLGSTGTKVARRCPLPVLVLRRP